MRNADGVSTTRPLPASATAQHAQPAKLGVVVIGRNEGERVRRCLESVVNQVDRVVYVDSGSSDGSVEMARGLGVHVRALDLSVRFTAARARNAGFERLLQLAPDLEMVQFVDGDCEMIPGWFDRAVRRLQGRPDVAVVFGRLRERCPDKTMYNRLCDMEWDTPVGEASSCGGNALMRVAAFRQVNGYAPDLIAGEEPELCVRLRRGGWKTLRIDADMALHDADISRFGQWWIRAVRCGHAYAEGASLHGRCPVRHNVRQVRSALFWATVVPILIVAAGVVALAWTSWSWILVALLVSGHGMLGLRVYRHRRRHGDVPKDAALYAAACLLAKFPQTIGILRHRAERLLNRRSALIEYKR